MNTHSTRSDSRSSKVVSSRSSSKSEAVVSTPPSKWPYKTPSYLPPAAPSQASSVTSSRPRSIGHYVLGKTIGEGTFGKVKAGTHIMTGSRVGVKLLEKERICDIADVNRVTKEIHILKVLQHPHVVRLYEIIETNRQLYMIMEFASGGELFDYIVESQRLKESEAARFMRQLISGVEYIHSRRAVHRDIKCENILLDEHRNIKIVDFGLSNFFKPGDMLKTACGSPCYAAPEMVAGKLYHPQGVDIWSCGIVLFAMVCGYLPFEDNNTASLYRKILKGELVFPDFLSEQVKDLLKGILNVDPNRRLTIEGIRGHPWLGNLGLVTKPYPSHCKTEECGRCDSWPLSWDEEILDKLTRFDYSRDLAIKSLEANKHNHLTTSYYLLLEAKLAAKMGKTIHKQSNTNLDDHSINGIIELAPRVTRKAPCEVQRPIQQQFQVSEPPRVSQVSAPSTHSSAERVNTHVSPPICVKENRVVNLPIQPSKPITLPAVPSRVTPRVPFSLPLPSYRPAAVPHAIPSFQPAPLFTARPPPSMPVRAPLSIPRPTVQMPAVVPPVSSRLLGAASPGLVVAGGRGEGRELLGAVGRELQSRGCYVRLNAASSLTCQKGTLRFEVEAAGGRGEGLLKFKRSLGTPQAFKGLIGDVIAAVGLQENP